MNIVFLGPPGVGKGTQAKTICTTHEIAHISTGDILREQVRKGTPLGQKARVIMESGELVSDEIILGMIKERILEPDCLKGCLFDGFPRTIHQAEGLDTILSECDTALDGALQLDAPEAEIVRRLTSRRVCKDCGRDYNLIFNPPPEDERCATCGGHIVQRPDDHEKTILNRLQVYSRQTAPLIDFYRNQEKLHIIDASKSVEMVKNSVESALGSL